MEFTVNRHADKLVIISSCNCLSMSRQVSRDTAEICSVALASPCHVRGGALKKKERRDFD